MASSGEDPLPSGQHSLDPAGWHGEDEAGVGSRKGDTGQTEREESYGPVTLIRHVKRDGRALVLFSHRTPDESRGTPDETIDDRQP